MIVVVPMDESVGLVVIVGVLIDEMCLRCRRVRCCGCGCGLVLGLVVVVGTGVVVGVVVIMLVLALVLVDFILD